MSISKIRIRYLTLRWLETIMFGLAAGMILLNISIYLSVVAALAVIVWRYFSLSKIDDLKIALYLNRFYPELKESGDLFIKDPGSLTTIEQIQLNRIQIPKVKLPHKLQYAVFALIIGGLLLFIPKPDTNQKSEIRNQGTPSQTDPSITSIVITITPPSYTRLAKTETDNFSFSAVEGSQITWKISYDQPIPRAKITMSGGDSIVITKPQQEIEFKYTVTSSILYRINGSEYYRIDVKPDQAPQVAIKELPQFIRLKWGERNSIDVTSTIADDYGLGSAHVIATVSKGSGESVKFREERLPFISPSKISGTNVTGKLTLDFRKLGMDPGDEVYFYVEAFDNKQPTPQRNRTDTYFVALQDTAQLEMSMNDGLGVDVMPDYFRSQRQLIIDTEKLLADQKAKKVTKKDFNSTSNELGYDQKVLRLRYGQFLGEEFETSIGESGVEENEEHEEDTDILKKFGHQHDTEDEATFFTQSIKAKLRAALTLMWDSELKLRTFQPKESLPTQYQILKLLKEISQDSRIYVHRMGFDPPPLKEDRRLTASLEEIKPVDVKNNTTVNYQYPAIRAALSDLQHADLHAAGEELAALALKSPGNYLQALSDLKLITENKMDSTVIRSKLEEIQKVFWTVLPNEAPSPTQKGASAHSLDKKLLKEINRND